MYLQQTNSRDDLNSFILNYVHSNKGLLSGLNQGGTLHRWEEYQNKVDLSLWLLGKVHEQLEFDNFDDGSWP